MKPWFLLIFLVLSLPARADETAASHLMAGARLFRTGEYAQALVEFRVAEKLGAGPQARLYVGATLVKLERPEDALEMFASTPAPSDALLTFYQALACYDARLYLCADRLLAVVGEEAGPKIGEQVHKIRGDIEATYRQEPSTDTIDWYLNSGASALHAGRASLATLYFQEAQLLGSRRKTPYREAEVAKGLQDAQAAQRGAPRQP